MAQEKRDDGERVIVTITNEHGQYLVKFLSSSRAEIATCSNQFSTQDEAFGWIDSFFHLIRFASYEIEETDQ